MVAMLMDHWKDIALAVVAVAEVVAIFVPGAQGTVKTLAAAMMRLGVSLKKE